MSEIIEGLDDKVMRLEEVSEQIRNLQEKREYLKDSVLKLMQENYLSVHRVEVSDQEAVVVRLYNKVTKSLDKDSLARDVNEEKEYLDYVGISKLTSEGIIIPEMVEKHLKKNRSSFVVAKTVYKYTKGGGSSE